MRVARLSTEPARPRVFIPMAAALRLWNAGRSTAEIADEIRLSSGSLITEADVANELARFFDKSRNAENAA
jgi:hypothetical protein